jgi:hypothetical protein
LTRDWDHNEKCSDERTTDMGNDYTGADNIPPEDEHVTPKVPTTQQEDVLQD